MSDAEIRDARHDAEVEAIRLRKWYDAERTKGWKEVAERSDRCSDMVYKTRHDAECASGIPLGLLYEDSRFTPSVDKLFEDNILGACIYAKTLTEARAWKCAPPP